MSDVVEKKPTTELETEAGEKLQFFVTRENYIKFINEIQPNKKYPAQFNFLMACIHKDQKERLGEIFQNNPQCVPEYMGYVIEDYKPDMAATVKKRNGTLID
jgi:hypothetical protein